MKKILVLGLCCGVTAVAFAAANKAELSNTPKAGLQAKNPVAAVKAAPSDVSTLNTTALDVAPKPGQSVTDAMYGYLKGMGEEIPSWMTAELFPMQGTGSPNRNGGDTFATATVIPFVAGGTYTDATGTTVGAVNDYDYATAPVLCNTSFFGGPTGSSFNGPDVVYTFTLPAGYTVSASTCGTASYDTCLGIVSASTGALVAVNDDGSGCSGWTSLIPACCLEAGTYYLVVDSYGNASGTFTLNLTFGATPCIVVDPCDDFDAATTAITLPYSGTLNNTGAPNVIGSIAGDVGYSFTLTEASSVTLDACIAGTAIDCDSYLYAGNPCAGGTQLLYNDGLYDCAVASYATSWFLDCGVLGAGDYTLVMTGYSSYEGAIAFNISSAPCSCPPINCVGTAEVEPNDGPNGSPVVYGEIGCGETVCGTVFTVNDNTRDTDWYELMVDAPGGIVTLNLDVEDFDGQLLLLGGDAATVIASANLGGFCTDETLTSDCLQPGFYYVFVSPTGFTGLDTPVNYGVTATCTPCTYVSPCDGAIALACGMTYSGDTTGGISYVGNPAPDDFYTFTSTSASTIYTFSMCGGATWDTYLRIYDRCPTDVGAVELMYNDDGCGTLQSVIETTLPVGTYYVVVEGYSSGYGPYDLSVICTTCNPITCVGTPEVEPNDGPNGDPIVFGSITNGQTICGTTFTQGDTLRDTDWYALNVAAPGAIVTANLDVEDFNGLLLLVAGNMSTVLASADAAGFCQDETMVSACLQAGTYYVFVAHNAFAGVDTPANYGLTVTTTECIWVDPYTACQAPATNVDSWTAGTTEVDVQGTNYLRADRFGGVVGAITGVDFRGLPLFLSGSWTPCSEVPLPVTIRFYDLAMNVVATYTANLTGVASEVYAGSYPSYDYHFDLPTPLVLSTGYFSVQGGGANTCWLLWMSSATGADGASLLSTDGGAWATDAFDLNYCFTTAAACDAPTGLAISMSVGNANLTWTAAPGALSYDVYGATDGYGPFTLLGNTVLTSYTDVNAQANGRKFYQIVTVCN